jgi:hypothetical protein
MYASAINDPTGDEMIHRKGRVALIGSATISGGQYASTDAQPFQAHDSKSC